MDIGKQATTDRTWIVISKPRTAADPGNAALANTILSNKTFIGQPFRQVGDQLFWHQTPAINNVAEHSAAVNTNSGAACGYDANKWAAAVGYVDSSAARIRAGSRQGGEAMRWSFAAGNLTLPRATNGSARTLRIGVTATNTDTGEHGDSHVGIVVIHNVSVIESHIADNVEYASQWMKRGGVWITFDPSS
ncbi:hypothetical protein [Stenotrophomonas tumulicola]|uniref:Uncharacterized protein n=1 Tax=Stenotrophomonas tumulicola TaxID=1685415 RepID=A0A7W3IJ89_9GAMM|nr:hypothetical protein [Stenotrophomonas tumulicola]MBA8683930.1 hypothetical protein [Stenotrophomonas tumulicola]